MTKRRLATATNVCLCALPPLVGFYGLWGAVAPLLPQAPPRAFLLGFVTGLCFALLGLCFAISISPGEK